MEPVDPLGRVQGKLSSTARSRLFSRVKVSDAQGLSGLAEPCISNINNVSNGVDVSLSKFQDTSLHTSFLQPLYALHNMTHLRVNAKALSEKTHNFSLSFTGQNILDGKYDEAWEAQKLYFLRLCSLFCDWFRVIWPVEGFVNI